MPEPSFAVTAFIAAHGQEALERLLEKADDELRSGSSIDAVEAVLPLAAYFCGELMPRSLHALDHALADHRDGVLHTLIINSDPGRKHSVTEVHHLDTEFELTPDPMHFGREHRQEHRQRSA